MSLILRRVACIALWTCSAGLGAAEIRGDQVFLCDAARDVSAALRPSALMLSAAQPIARKAYAEAFGGLAASYAQALSPALLQRRDVQTFVEVLQGASGEGFAHFQIGRVPGKNAEIVFRDTGADIEFDCAKLEQYQIDMASVSLVTAVILQQRAVPEFQARAEAVAAQSRKHENLVKNGLAMWPWELWLNGKRLGEGDASRLFDRQIVFMRPSAGIAMNTRDQASASMDAALALEPIGFVQYTDDSYSTWWGLSAVVITTTGHGMGYGVLARYGNYAAGLTRHKSDVPGASDDTYLMFSVDLYDLVQKKRAELPGVKEKLRAQAQELLK